MIRTFAAALLALALLAPLAAAQETLDDGTAVAPAEDRAAGFRAVEGAEGESVPGGMLLIGAYGLVWLFTFAYLYRLGRLGRAQSEEIARLEAQLDEMAGERSG